MTYDFSELAASLRAGVDAPANWAERAPQGVRAAAVLLLFTDAPDPRLTFIERASTLRRHAGQVAFPGGGREEADESLMHAALREAQEEVALDPSLVEVLGQLPVAWVPRSRYDVTPFVGRWDGSKPLRAADPAEVEWVFDVPVSELVDPANRVSGSHPLGYRGPAWVFGEMFIWGFTGHLLDLTLRLAGWEQAWDQERTVDIPARFMRD